MVDKEFYKIIDDQISNLILTFEKNEFLKKQNANGKKSFGFLLWFMRRYLPETNIGEIEKYIVEGDDDSSCDLVFENYDNFGNKVFYVVQAKWFTEVNINKTNEITKEIKACLTDFRLILQGKKKPSNININFNTRYQEFLNHKDKNGKIKFLFVALCKGPDHIDAYVNDFVSTLVEFDLLDINRLKKNFIEIEFKGIKTHNPIETPYEPKGEMDLAIKKSDWIGLKEPLPYKSYIFLIKPSLIHYLFEKYGFALFYKNIRNPLPRSVYNDDIVKTIKDNPLNFWYFNNGITAITDNIHDFHSDSENIKVNGLQVINGAQTVFSIYSAYKDATTEQRRSMDENALITLRLLRTGGKDFDLSVTRYTNAQNPIRERDFHSNDDVQRRIQNEFYENTNVWYETRRGEFRKKIKGVDVVPNEILGQSYLAYFLEEPFLAKSKKDKIFISSFQNKEGLYEKIFNEKTNSDDLLLSYYLFLFVEKKRHEYRKKTKKIAPDKNGNYSKKDLILLEYNSFIQYATFDIIALFKSLLFHINSDNLKGVNGKLFNDYRNGYKKISQYYNFIINGLKEYISDKKDKTLVLSVYFKTKDTYGELKEYLKSKASSAERELKL